MAPANVTGVADATPRRRLAGKVALVTGASGGLGSRFATVLAEEGATVVLAARRVAALEALAKALYARSLLAVPLTLDVTSPASIRDGVAKVGREIGPIDILVNNSGVALDKPVLEQSEADWDRVIDTNLKGPFLLSTEVSRQLRDAQRPGCIINVASILGLRQGGRLTPYAVSKAGIVQLTKQMALELARYRIRVNAIAPGYIETDMNREFLASGAGAAIIGRIPLRRAGQPPDLDGPLLLLASDDSRFMTGAVLVVDGGHVVGSL
jgi:NAD(P)-dependent dehydrogenase (short-subunit alcohol dehydrogenase family)